jgi:hypothetical protein
MQVINNYRITLKVGYFIIDNTDNNNTIIEALSIRTYNRFIGHKIGFIAHLCSVTSTN